MLTSRGLSSLLHRLRQRERTAAFQIESSHSSRSRLLFGLRCRLTTNPNACTTPRDSTPFVPQYPIHGLAVTAGTAISEFPSLHHWNTLGTRQRPGRAPWTGPSHDPRASRKKKSFFAPLTLHKIFWDSAGWYYDDVNELDPGAKSLRSPRNQLPLCSVPPE